MSRGQAGANPIEAFGLPRPGKKMSAREFAIFLLRVGAEIEHSLLVQYLYAAYSVDERAEDDTSDTGLRWKTDIRLIAREEMAHLVTVQNLLLSLKTGELHLNRGPIDKDVKILPLPFQLEPLSESSLEKYILFESPSPKLLPEKTWELVKKIQRRLGCRFLSVGNIYAALYWLFLESDEPGDHWPFADESVNEFRRTYKKEFHLTVSDFVDRSTYLERAAKPEEWGVYEDETRVDSASPRDTALGSLRWIMAQGEGPSVIEESHFLRFVQMYKKFKQLGRDSPILPVPSNPQIRRNGGGTLIRNRVSRRWAELGNSRYQLLILNIFESLNAKRTRETNNRLLFAKWAISEMELLKKIGQILPRMFLARSAVRSAGAIFEEVTLPKTKTERLVHRQRLLESSNSLIAEIDELRKRKHVAEHTDDETVAGLEESLLDAVARQNDEMREALRQTRR